jgi:hypothetical protein
MSARVSVCIWGSLYHPNPHIWITTRRDVLFRLDSLMLGVCHEFSAGECDGLFTLAE